MAPRATALAGCRATASPAAVPAAPTMATSASIARPGNVWADEETKEEGDEGDAHAVAFFCDCLYNIPNTGS